MKKETEKNILLITVGVKDRTVRIWGTFQRVTVIPSDR
jgi:hypothetical protein